MHLILTHDQADFDALASLLAARLLEPEALAVLPRRLNRNARAYLTLYGDRLPFLEPDDVPRGPVDQVTLVDTQSLPSTRGTSRATRVRVIDHHPPSASIDSSWATHIEQLGATSTLLVEQLREGEPELELIVATLLLLGIYEDTGSLTYAGTSPRDVMACAWLLERGASLPIADDFLNHPLSSAQRLLYDRLLGAAETFAFHGLTVVVACAAAEGMIDEISTLAHKLRDLFDPAALFVLVALDGTVQLVARSDSDSIDVARVAEHFGGGGHNRAAAALIHDRTPEQVRDELLALLDHMVEPARTVGEIMSRGPQLLPPTATVAEAAERMQRFGHEGYPVVERGQVVGLLTRRAVDRAMAHGMGARPVSAIMNAGSVVVSPTDSVQHLQRVMIQHDWGQVPVADPTTGEIVGIVTRTDLLNTLAPGAQPASLAPRLEAALPPTRLRLLQLVAHQADSLHCALYIVGGFVRDLLLGAPSVDLDLVVEGDAVALARGLAAAYGGRVSSHARFGTAKWRIEPGQPALLAALGAPPNDSLPASLDFVSARTEFYAHPTALPSVERGSIKLDLHRRDFTINTLALRLDGHHYGQLLDPWGGGRDLQDRLVRVLHSISFVDDPTRMLRAVRLEQRLGFQIEQRTLELLGQALPLLDRVSGERVRNELALVFREAGCTRILDRLHALGILEAIHPCLTWDAWLRERFEAARGFVPPAAWRTREPLDVEAALYALWLCRLPAEDAAQVAERLHCPATLRGGILEVNRLSQAMPRWPREIAPSEVVSRLEGQRETTLSTAWMAMPESPEARELVERYLAEWRTVAPQTGGEVLRRLGVAPGPRYGEILWALRAAWLDGQINTAEQEQVLLKRLVEDAATGG
jgi:tRNA nucleotidyltransferase (CCA-adding enzyme)